MKYFFCAISTCFCWHQITFCATSNFFLKCYVMVIYFYCHVATKNIITCQKNVKFDFHVTQKKLTSLFIYLYLFIFNFYVAHWHHVDLLCSGPRNKKTFNQSFCFTHLLDRWKQLRRAVLEKNYLGLIFVKHLWRAYIFTKLQASFQQLFQKWTL